MNQNKESGEIFDRRKKINSKFKRTDERILVKDKSYNTPDYFSGRIIAIAGKNFIVKNLDKRLLLKEIECTSSGTFYTAHDNSTLLTVGDIVNYSLEEDQKLGKIHSVELRNSWLSRKPIIGSREDVIASNASYSCIIASCDEPILNPRIIDRLLVASEIGNLEPIIIINKTDLSDIKIIKKELNIYKKLGYRIFYISLKNRLGLDDVKKFLTGKETVLIGASGVGKSSLLNFLLKNEVQKIMSISSKSNKGKHTTSSSKLFEIDESTVIIDTPGIREFGIVNIAKEELTLYFRDFQKFYEHCRFMPCTHTHEPECEIKRAVENGKIQIERYQSYLNIFDSIY